MPALKSLLCKPYFCPGHPALSFFYAARSNLHLSPPPSSSNRLRGKKAAVQCLTTQMLTLTKHLWGEKSVFAHAPRTYSAHAAAPLLCGPGSCLRVMCFTFCIGLCGFIPLSWSDFYRFTIPARGQGRFWVSFLLKCDSQQSLKGRTSPSCYRLKLLGKSYLCKVESPSQGIIPA